MKKMLEFIKDNEQSLPAIFTRMEIKESKKNNDKKSIVKTVKNSAYNTDRYQVKPFFKDIIRYL